MPPLLTPTALAAPSASPLHAPPAANYVPWNNRLPTSFKQLDRKYVLQADNTKFLEMHPNGTRGVKQITEFCLLTIYVLNISSLVNSSKDQGAPHLADWLSAPSAGKTFGKQSEPNHILQQSATGNYLCMDNQSVVYQKGTYDPESCIFHHTYDQQTYRDRYYREGYSKNKTVKWYVGINKDGSIRCGNVTRKKQKGANFNRIEIPSNVSDSPPYEGTARKCCPKNKCKKKNRRKDKSRRPVKTDDTIPDRDKQKSCYKKWCRRRRRNFFTLNLKNVNRYYKRCIKNKDKIRHCKNR